MLDAYTVRKAVPRIVIAVIGINISIYLCLAAVDIVNVVGGGIAHLLTQPFDTAGLNTFGVKTDVSSAIVGTVGIAVGAKIMTGALASTAGAAGSAGGAVAFASDAIFALFFLLIPILLLALGILAVVVIRQALLFFLIVTSPVAIACFVLPGTEKYFQKWLDLFIKTLLVYPIIAVMFALSDVFSSIIFSTNTGNLGIAKIITGIVVIFAPLFLIPFAFRLAGGAIASLSKVAGGAGQRISEMGPLKNRREFYGQRMKDNYTRGRVNALGKAESTYNNSRGLRKRAAKFRMGAISGYREDAYDRESALNKAGAEHIQETTGFGNDALQRAYTADKEAGDRSFKTGPKQEKFEKGADGTFKKYLVSENGLARQDVETGAMQYRSAGGSWQNESAVVAAERKYGKKNMTQYQASMAYEMGKANTQEEQDHLTRAFASKMETWDATGGEANNAWIGAGFAKQEKNRSWKHARWSKDDATGQYKITEHGSKLIQEYDTTQGSYQGGSQNAESWSVMSESVMQAQDELNISQTEMARLTSIPTGARTPDQNAELEAHRQNILEQQKTLQQASRIVDNIRTTQQPRDADGQIIPGAAPLEIIGQGASPKTQEAMKIFAQITDSAAGKYTDPTPPIPLPTSPDRPAESTFKAQDDRDRPR